MNRHIGLHDDKIVGVILINSFWLHRFVQNDNHDTKFDGTPVHGERYLPFPEAMRTFLAKVEPRKAPAKYCIFKPLSLFTGSEAPEFVIFFARPEVLTGLFIYSALVAV